MTTGIEYLKKRKWRDFADVLEKEEEILKMQEFEDFPET